MNKFKNKIDARDRTVYDVLNEKKYTVDYFQREYSWEEKHIEQLVSDLTSSFLNEYSAGDSRADGENYNNYYMGPFVVSQKIDGMLSIIDGQQRLTSLTLLLIYINNLQKNLGLNESIDRMIFSESRGVKSFNVQVQERTKCLQSLFETGEYQVKEDDDTSTMNMANRYYDIEKAFPEELKTEVLSFFMDWLKYNVILVEIIAYSDDNAYTIFETMNDRGLNLTPTEMLKGYVLSRLDNDNLRASVNDQWKHVIKELQEYSKDEDLRFMQAWLRAQYADTIRQGKVGSSNEDFEKIGTRFHSWVRDNLSKMGVLAETSEQFNKLITEDFKFFYRAYIQILKSQSSFNPKLENVYYIKDWGIAPSLSFPLMLAPLSLNDSADVVTEKLNLVAKFIETFVVRRAINYRLFAANSIRYTMYSLVKEIRHSSVSKLKDVLQNKLNEMSEKWEGFKKFGMHGQNKFFIKFLLSRMSAHIDKLAGVSTNYDFYFRPTEKPFEIEHIWANHYERFTDEFSQRADFEVFRNRIGALALLPKGTNQSYSDKSYKEKCNHYVKENLLLSSLHRLTYQNNPNFLNMIKKTKLLFKPYEDFKKAEIEERQHLYQKICEDIWGNLG